MSDIEKYWIHVVEAEAHEEKVNLLRERTRERLYQADRRRDAFTLDLMVSEDPTVRAAIADQQFSQGKAVMYGPGAILEMLTRIEERGGP